MRIIFMGTPDFAVSSLVGLVESGENEVVAVVTQPDKPKGRGKAVQYSPVKEKAIEYGIDLYQPVKVKDKEFVKVLEGYKPDVIVVVAFGQIISKEILDMPKYGCVNVHGSLLPKYRGAAPIQWAVIDGEEESGVTTMLMDEGIDTGDILMKKVYRLDKKETGGSLFDKLSELGAELLIDTLKALEEGTYKREKQDDSKSNYAKRLDKKTGAIDFTRPAVQLECLIRGLNPWPSAYTMYNGKTLKIWDADVVEDEYPGEPGQIVSVSKDEIIVKTGDGCLSLKEIQLEGKKRMTVDAFLRGYLVEVGTVLKF